MKCLCSYSIFWHLHVQHRYLVEAGLHPILSISYLSGRWMLIDIMPYLSIRIC